MIDINSVLYNIRKLASQGEDFELYYVRSAGKTAGSIGRGTFLFKDYMDTKEDEIKIENVEDGRVRTPKISHLISFNKMPIKH